MKIGTITRQDMPSVTFPEGLLADAIKTYIKRSNFPKKIIIKHLDLLLDKYISKQEHTAKRIVAVNEGNNATRTEIERLRQKTSRMVIELRGKLS